jgi:hypothetical protein
MTRLGLLVLGVVVLAGCASTEPRVARTQNCNNPNQCTIKVINPTCGPFSCTAEVDFELTVLERGRNNFKLTWVLPEGYGFCDTAGDGVWLKEIDRNDQFDSPRAERPSGTGPCRFTEFQLRGKNTRSMPSEPYYYMIQFHGPDGKKYIIDPRIMNG